MKIYNFCQQLIKFVKKSKTFKMGNLNEELIEASKKGDLSQVKTLITNGANITIIYLRDKCIRFVLE